MSTLAEDQKNHPLPKELEEYRYIMCDCGHLPQDHYQGNGWCHHSKHANPGACGCTWYWPNRKYIEKKMKQESKRKNDSTPAPDQPPVPSGQGEK